MTNKSKQNSFRKLTKSIREKIEVDQFGVQRLFHVLFWQSTTTVSGHSDMACSRCFSYFEFLCFQTELGRRIVTDPDIDMSTDTVEHPVAPIA